MATEAVAFVKRHHRALLLGATAVYIWSKVRVLSAPHHSPLGLLGAPPDATMFPNFFYSEQGLWIYQRHWNVENPIGHVFLCHGIGEHIGRYERVAAMLNAQGYSVHGIDHQGHGMSEGERGYFTSLESMATDYLQFVSLVDCGTLPCFLIGHSMGGLISVFIGSRSVGKWKGIVFSGPALLADPNVATPFKLAIANFVANYLPKLTIEKLNSDGVCEHKQVVRRYQTDPLVYRGGLHLRVVTELFRSMPLALDLARTTKWPSVFVVHGEKDMLCLPRGSQIFFGNLDSSDKECRMYPDMSHEVFNESGSALDDAINWLKART